MATEIDAEKEETKITFNTNIKKLRDNAHRTQQKKNGSLTKIGPKQAISEKKCNVSDHDLRVFKNKNVPLSGSTRRIVALSSIGCLRRMGFLYKTDPNPRKVHCCGKK